MLVVQSQSRFILNSIYQSCMIGEGGVVIVVAAAVVVVSSCFIDVVFLVVVVVAPFTSPIHIKFAFKCY